MARRRRSRRIAVRRAVLLVGFVALLAFVTLTLLAGSPTRLPAGTTVGGLDVGGMGLAEATHELEARSDALAHTSVQFVAGGRTFTATASQLGVRADWKGAVRAAANAGDGVAPIRGLKRIQSRLFGSDVEPHVDVYPSAVRYTVARIAAAVDRPAVDASLERIERTPEGSLAVHLRRAGGGDPLVAEVDSVVAATGFQTPLRDLPSLGVSVTGQSRLPVQTSWWESATLPGVHFAGTITQGARGLRRHGVPANSGAVHGARYNGRLLARRLAGILDGAAIERPAIGRDAAVDLVARELTSSAELFHQRGYLARVLSTDPSGGMRDEGTQPLTHFLDEGGPDAVGITLEADGSGSIYPTLYTRIRGASGEHGLEPQPGLRYDGTAARAAIAGVLARLPG